MKIIIPENRPTPKSASIMTDACGEVRFSNDSDIRDLYKVMADNVETAIVNDRAEVEIARGYLRTWYCTDGHDASASVESFAQLEARARAVIGELDELLVPFVETAGMIVGNMGAVEQWKAIIADLGDLEQRARELSVIPQWSGAAAQQYADNTMRNAERTHVLVDLVRNTKGSVEAVSVIQTVIAQITADCLHFQNLHVEKSGNVEFNEDSTRENLGSLSRGKLLDHQFYKRTRFMIEIVERAKCQLESVAAESQEWQAASQDIGAQLAAATKAALCWQGASTDYDTDVDADAEDLCTTGGDDGLPDGRFKPGW